MPLTPHPPPHLPLPPHQHQGEAKERFNAIQQELSQLSTKFSNNVGVGRPPRCPPSSSCRARACARGAACRVHQGACALAREGRRPAATPCHAP